MTTVIFGSVALIMIAVIYLQTVDSLKMRSGIILTMSFPSCAAGDEDIKSAIKNIKTSLIKLCIISFILFLPKRRLFMQKRCSFIHFLEVMWKQPCFSSYLT